MIDTPRTMAEVAESMETLQEIRDDGLLHGRGALPSLKVLLEWYCYGALEKEYEEEEGVKTTYEWYQKTLER